jgi:hypothetical protein
MSLSTTTPLEMKTKVGMALTLYLAAVSGFSSTSTLQNTTSVQKNDDIGYHETQSTQSKAQIKI